jgi:hypothetical protein
MMSQEILEKEGIRDFKKDIRQMSKTELQGYFAFGSGRLNVTGLIKNLIWQMHIWIKEGKEEPIEGNIRSFWYLSVKPVLSRLGLEVSGRQYPERVYDAFVELVVVHRLFRYIDIGFLDERIYHRTIGQKNGNLILMVEKDGLFSLAKKVALEHDTTAIALGGFPSYLTMEYLVSDMAKKGLLRQPVQVFSVVDHDPSGYWIEQEFVSQLKSYGVEVENIHALVDPQALPREVVEVVKYKLQPGAKTRNWLKHTGGIAGKPYGLEADALGGKRIRELYIKAILPYLRQPSRSVQEVNKEQEEFLRWLVLPPAYVDGEQKERQTETADKEKESESL